MVFLHLFLLPLFSLIIIALPSPEDTRPISDPSNTKHHSTSLTSIWDRIEHIWEWGEDEPKLYITTKDPDPSKRKEEVQRNRDGYDYGPPKLGETSYFPSGTLAEEMVRRQRAEWIAEQAPFAVPVEGEEISARRAVVWDGKVTYGRVLRSPSYFWVPFLTTQCNERTSVN